MYLKEDYTGNKLLYAVVRNEIKARTELSSILDKNAQLARIKDTDEIFQRFIKGTIW
jgi:hypothetical protein